MQSSTYPQFGPLRRGGPGHGTIGHTHTHAHTQPMKRNHGDNNNNSSSRVDIDQGKDGVFGINLANSLLNSGLPTHLLSVQQAT